MLLDSYRAAEEKLILAEEKLMLENRKLKTGMILQKDQLSVSHKHTLRNLRVRQSARLSKHEENVRQHQVLVVDMRDMMFEHAAEEESRRRLSNKQVRAAAVNETKQAERAEANMRKMREWKGKYESLQDEMEKQRNKSEEYVDELTNKSQECADELVEWKEMAESMREQYEDAINEMTPSVIEKVWVQNVDKRGELHCKHSSHYLLVLTSFLLFSMDHRRAYDMEASCR